MTVYVDIRHWGCSMDPSTLLSGSAMCIYTSYTCYTLCYTGYTWYILVCMLPHSVYGLLLSTGVSVSYTLCPVPQGGE